MEAGKERKEKRLRNGSLDETNENLVDKERKHRKKREEKRKKVRSSVPYSDKGKTSTKLGQENVALTLDETNAREGKTDELSQVKEYEDVINTTDATNDEGLNSKDGGSNNIKLVTVEDGIENVDGQKENITDKVSLFIF